MLLDGLRVTGLFEFFGAGGDIKRLQLLQSDAFGQTPGVELAESSPIRQPCIVVFDLGDVAGTETHCCSLAGICDHPGQPHVVGLGQRPAAPYPLAF